MKIAQLFAAKIRSEDVPYIVPVESATGQVGPHFIEYLAAELKGEYQRDPDNIGLMGDFSVLKGRWCDPERVHPLIHEFYEHTSRLVVAVRPKWNQLFLPLFWLCRKVFAELVDQFNLPIDDAEADRGIESHIDCIDINRDKIQDIRGWVRTYAGTDTTVYVGVYTTVVLSDGPYVSVGFPLPDANLTATLVPMNRRQHDFLLKSRKWGSKWAGDYIAFVDESPQRRVSAFRMRGLREEIEVYVRRGELLTDHRFYFLGCKFLTLFYTLTRKSTPTTPHDISALAVRAAAIQAARPARLVQRP